MIDPDLEKFFDRKSAIASWKLESLPLEHREKMIADLKQGKSQTLGQRAANG